MATKEIRRARVILKEAKTYTHPATKRKFIRDVPQTVEGNDVEEYGNNGFFKTVELQPIIKKIKKSKGDDAEDVVKKKTGKKKLKKKTGTKKKISKKKNKKK